MGNLISSINGFTIGYVIFLIIICSVSYLLPIMKKDDVVFMNNGYSYSFLTNVEFYQSFRHFITYIQILTLSLFSKKYKSYLNEIKQAQLPISSNFSLETAGYFGTEINYFKALKIAECINFMQCIRVFLRFKKDKNTIKYLCNVMTDNNHMSNKRVSYLHFVNSQFDKWYKKDYYFSFHQEENKRIVESNK